MQHHQHCAKFNITPEAGFPVMHRQVPPLPTRLLTMVKKDALNLRLEGPTGKKEAQREREREREKEWGDGKGHDRGRKYWISRTGVGEVPDLPESCLVLWKLLWCLENINLSYSATSLNVLLKWYWISRRENGYNYNMQWIMYIICSGRSFGNDVLNSNIYITCPASLRNNNNMLLISL